MNTSKTVVGVDIAKRVFQLCWVEMETGEMVSLQLKREKFLEHFATRAPCLIGMEACGGSQHWARQLPGLGHVVKLLPGKAVKPFVGGNKSDVHDARAIWTAVQQPGVKTVAVKSEEQQAVLALHRMRPQLVKFRTAQFNGLRGLLAEYGEVMSQGSHCAIRPAPGTPRGCRPSWSILVSRSFVHLPRRILQCDPKHPGEFFLDLDDLLRLHQLATQPVVLTTQPCVGQ